MNKGSFNKIIRVLIWTLVLLLGVQIILRIVLYPIDNRFIYNIKNNNINEVELVVEDHDLNKIEKIIEPGEYYSMESNYIWGEMDRSNVSNFKLFVNGEEIYDYGMTFSINQPYVDVKDTKIKKYDKWFFGLFIKREYEDWIFDIVIKENLINME